MKDSEFKLLDPLADSINDKFEELHEAGAFKHILHELKKAVAQPPNTYSVSFDIRVNVFDTDREKGLSLLTMGFNANKGQEPYRHYGDTSPQKYLVDGEMCIVPENSYRGRPTKKVRKLRALEEKLGMGVSAYFDHLNR
ncbi:MAG: hypothetical protein ACYSYM_16480 [Planctomycetota bacterium]|jgi:hypothetical protein